MSFVARWIIAQKSRSAATRGTNSHTSIVRSVASSALAVALACGRGPTTPETTLHATETATPTPAMAGWRFAGGGVGCDRSAPILFNGYPRVPVNGALLAVVNLGTQLSIAAAREHPNGFLDQVSDIKLGVCSSYEGPQTSGIINLAHLFDEMNSTALRRFEYEYDAAGNRLGISFNFEQMVLGGAGSQTHTALVLRGLPFVFPLDPEMLLRGAVVAQRTISIAQQGPFTGAYVLLVSAGASNDAFNRVLAGVEVHSDGEPFAFTDGDTGTHEIGHFVWKSPVAVCFGGSREDLASCLATGGSMIDEIRVADSSFPIGRIVRSILTFTALGPGAVVKMRELLIDDDARKIR